CPPVRGNVPEVPRPRSEPYRRASRIGQTARSCVKAKAPPRDEECRFVIGLAAARRLLPWAHRPDAQAPRRGVGRQDAAALVEGQALRPSREVRLLVWAES